MTKKEILDELDTLEIDLDDLQDVEPADKLEYHKQNVQVLATKMIIEEARKLCRGNPTPKELNLLGISILLAQGVNELRCEVAELKAAKSKK